MNKQQFLSLVCLVKIGFYSSAMEKEEIRSQPKHQITQIIGHKRGWTSELCVLTGIGVVGYYGFYRGGARELAQNGTRLFNAARKFGAIPVARELISELPSQFSFSAWHPFFEQHENKLWTTGGLCSMVLGFCGIVWPRKPMIIDSITPYSEKQHYSEERKDGPISFAQQVAKKARKKKKKGDIRRAVENLEKQKKDKIHEK